MDSAFHKLNMLKEFKNRKRSLDRKRLKKWVAAVALSASLMGAFRASAGMVARRSAGSDIPKGNPSARGKNRHCFD